MIANGSFIFIVEENPLHSAPPEREIRVASARYKIDLFFNRHVLLIKVLLDETNYSTAKSTRASLFVSAFRREKSTPTLKIKFICL